jgi:membrane fusion protein (multidrug efflux system)
MKIRNIIIVVALIAVLLVLKLILFPSHSEETKGPQQAKGGAAVITAYVLRSETLSNEVYASGTAVANEQVELQPEISGKVVLINFSEGTAVTKGQLLVKINDAELQAQSKKLKLQHALAEERMKRQEKLLAVQGISQEEFDVVKNEFEVIRAEMEFSEAQIAKTEIRAPFNGVIGLKNVSPGAFVSPSVVIASIQQVNPVKIDFSLSERYSSLVKKGDRIVFSLEGQTEKMNAEVFAVEPRIDMATRSLKVRALCSNKDSKVFPGAFVRVQLALSEIDSAMMIPTESIVPVLKGQKVFRIRGGKAESVKVETGLRTDQRIQITNGLQPGDTVAVTGIMQLRDGAQVKITGLKK